MSDERVITFDVKSFDVYVMGQKGLHFLRGLLAAGVSEKIANVVCSRDSRVLEDQYSQIENLAKASGLKFTDRKESLSSNFRPSELAFAVAWRWKIENYPSLVVLHDSLLPKYRGFNPLVSALIDGANEVGVTAVIGTPNYDCGDIIQRIVMPVSYPIKISAAILGIAEKYQTLASQLGENIRVGNSLAALPQISSQSTYSVWRDDDDYWTNWEWDSEKIKRFIDASGFPYLGARALANKREIILHEAETIENVIVNNRDPGKILFMDGVYPIVICGEGLLKITNAVYRDTQESCIGQLPFRTRFSG